ncbi:unnamed protein product [Allacma fusca]|uniref:Thioredoxin reductase n=1 Tax=Allacma fusca TaxID=39272 RepID=A0A8J2PLD9_9HEXA|nr:unnamed protein product [Allacma fusca]
MGITVGKCGSGAAEKHNYEYDLFVLGGGSGGISVAREASKFGAKVGLCDYVIPSGTGTVWGLGGTCVNVGCIPKKIMHHAALVGETLTEANFYGWDVNSNLPENKWADLVAGSQGHIKSLNWGYKLVLHEAAVKYFNEFASFVDSHTIKTTNSKGVSTNRTANRIVIAVGGRPRYLDIPGGMKDEFTVTSDDIFSLSYNPGDVLCVGGSYVALECASFLAGLGYTVTVMARSILLRGMDRQMAGYIQSNMEAKGIKFKLNCAPTSITKLSDGTPPTLQVTAKSADGVFNGEYNTVLVAIGRDAATKDLTLENAGVIVNPENGRIPTNSRDQTNVKNIYAIGDVADNRPELTPVAIKAGLLLARRLFDGRRVLMDYTRIPTTVYTQLEYSCVGLSEDEALEKYGKSSIEIYHTTFTPLEFQLPMKTEYVCYIKILTLKSDKERIVGFHYLGPNAGEVCQGFAVAIRLGARKSDLDATCGIHPTNAETATTLTITKSSGQQAVHTAC